MPSHADHCKHSLKRYGQAFSDLHRWMDEPSTLLGPSHRKVRHDPNLTPSEVKRLFGEFADHACLDHIRLDELETRRKSRTSGLWYRMTDFDQERQTVSFEVEAQKLEPIIFEDLPFFEDLSQQRRKTTRFGLRNNWKKFEGRMAEEIETKFRGNIHPSKNGRDIVNRLRGKVNLEVYGAPYGPRVENP